MFNLVKRLLHLSIPKPYSPNTKQSEKMPGITEEPPKVVEETPAPAPTSKVGSKYDAVPGPLGIASASLEGKVALVTGAGK